MSQQSLVQQRLTQTHTHTQSNNKTVIIVRKVTVVAAFKRNLANLGIFVAAVTTFGENAEDLLFGQQ